MSGLEFAYGKPINMYKMLDDYLTLYENPDTSRHYGYVIFKYLQWVEDELRAEQQTHFREREAVRAEMAEISARYEALSPTKS